MFVFNCISCLLLKSLLNKIYLYTCTCKASELPSENKVIIIIILSQISELHDSYHYSSSLLSFVWNSVVYKLWLSNLFILRWCLLNLRRYKHYLIEVNVIMTSNQNRCYNSGVLVSWLVHWKREKCDITIKLK